MAGHSKFANIKHRKDAQDIKRSKLFVKISKEILVAIKRGGTDIETNSSLRNVIDKAKTYNMPKDNYLKIIKKASTLSQDLKNYETIFYEGYGPGDVAFIVECLTDNRNRSSSNIKSYFNKFNGNLGQTNSVLYMFEQKGFIGFESYKFNEETIFDWALEINAENLESDKHNFLIITSMKNFDKTKKFFNNKGIKEFNVLELKWIPNQTIIIKNNEVIEKVKKFINILENDDDVQNVYHNFEI